MQNDFNTYNLDIFEFKILKVVEDEEKSFYVLAMERIYLEGQYIDKYNSIKDGYNIEHTFNEIIQNNKYRIHKDLDKSTLLYIKENGILTLVEKKLKKKERGMSKKKYELDKSLFKKALKLFVQKGEKINFSGYINCLGFFDKYFNINRNKLNDLLIKKDVLIDRVKLSDNSKNSGKFILKEEEYKDERGNVINGYKILQMNYEGFKHVCRLIYKYEESLFYKKYLDNLKDV